MQTQAVYDFINAHASDAMLLSRMRALETESEEGYARGLSALARERGHDLPEDLVSAWMNQAFAEYEQHIAQGAELSDAELDLVSGGSGTTTIGNVRCAGGYQCRTCCPNQKCNTCYCPIVGPC